MAPGRRPVFRRGDIELSAVLDVWPAAHDAPTHVPASISIVVLTCNRRLELDRTLTRLAALPMRPPIIVVDNASGDGTAAFVRDRHPAVELVLAPRNLGAAGRNLGVACVWTRYVAFSDDDTWWEPEALGRAVALLEAHPRLAVVNAQVRVAPSGAVDQTCLRMTNSPLAADGLPGERLISFMAGAAVMRTAAYREVGGYEPRFFLGGEEALLSLDLAARGWSMIYAPEVVTNHAPSASRNVSDRQVTSTRNGIWLAWLRLPASIAWRSTSRLLADAATRGQRGASLRRALAGAFWVLRNRRVSPPSVVAMWQRIFMPDTLAPALRQEPAGLAKDAERSTSTP